MTKYNKIIFWSGVAIILISCGGNNIYNVSELILQLKSQGLQIISEDSLDISSLTHARIDEAVLVQGENLKIEIYRIEDNQTFKLFIGSGVLISRIEDEVGEVSGMPEEMWFKKPFIVIIREEPQPGLVIDALTEAFN